MVKGVTRKSRKRRKRQRDMFRLVLIILITLLLMAGIAFGVLLLTGALDGVRGKKEKAPEVITTEEGETIPTSEGASETETETTASYADVLEEAKVTAAMYDYDTAISMVEEAVPDYANYAELTDFIADCETKKSELVVWSDNTQITHVFFHTLIKDTSIAFDVEKLGQTQVNAYNEVMTTIGEFNEIIQQMYDRGFVLVRLSDIASFDESTGQMTYNQILLPAGKTPFVLSEDDVSYYEYMNKTGGYAQRLVVTDDGKIMNECDNADGTTDIGAYDVLPLLDAFIEEHPDFSYHGAKGIIALTGYNGILGYRTSYITYGNSDVLQTHYDELFVGGQFDEAHAYELAQECHTKEMNPEQSDAEHIEYTEEQIQAEREKAAAVAEAIKADGWEFASHTWGHMDMSTVVDQATGTITSERLQRDTRWWAVEVEPLIGDTDIIIFAKGADIGSWRGYTDDNAAFTFLKGEGFNYYCNVDSSQYFVQLSSTVGGNGYFRQGRRNLDGFALFKDLVYPDKNILTDLFDSWTVFDFDRPLPVYGVTLPDGFTGLTKPDGTFIPISTE